MSRVKKLLRARLDHVLDLADERQKTSPATKIALRHLQLAYRGHAREGRTLPSVWETGFRVFSQFDEDGVALFLLAVAGTGSRRFVDIGAGDGVRASNTANLALNLGFDGLLIDAKPSAVETGREFYARHPDTRERPPVFIHAFLSMENVNDVVGEAGFEGEIDFLSIDIDGNDYWIWQALECISPRFVVIETHTELGLEDWVMPYDPTFDHRTVTRGARIGASPAATTRLAEDLGYRMVGANMYGFNVFYARHDVVPELVPAVELAELFKHGSYARTGKRALGS